MQSSHTNDPNQSGDFLNVKKVPFPDHYYYTGRNDARWRPDTMMIEVAASSNFKADSPDGKLLSDTVQVGVDWKWFLASFFQQIDKTEVYTGKNLKKVIMPNSLQKPWQ